MRYANARQKWRGSMNARRRCVKDRLAVRRMCRLVLVSCALGLLVCTALSPGYGESTHGMEGLHGNGFKGGGSSGGIKSNIVWIVNKNGIMRNIGNKNRTSKMSMGNMNGSVMNYVQYSTISSGSSYEGSEHRDTKDIHDSHSSRGDHDAYDRSHGSVESDRNYKDNDNSKGHHRDRNESKIQRLHYQIIKRDQGSSSTSKGKGIKAKTNVIFLMDRNKMSSHENNEMSTVRSIENHIIISFGYNKHNDSENKEINSTHHYENHDSIGHNTGKRSNSHAKGDESYKYSLSFLRGNGSRVWRFTRINGKPSHGPSHGNSTNSYDSSKNDSIGHGDGHRNVPDKTTANTTTDSTTTDSYDDIEVL